jgi:hypothetical protein
MAKLQNRNLRALKDTLKSKYTSKNTEKMNFFVENHSLEGILAWFRKVVFVSLDTEWWDEHIKVAPITEVSIAAIRGEELMEFAEDVDNANLEDFLSKIEAWHIRPKETCHMVNRGDWIKEGTEEEFLFGTTSFLEGAKSSSLSQPCSLRTVGARIQVRSAPL